MSTSYGTPDAEIILGETQLYLADFGDTAVVTGPINVGEVLTGTPTITQESVSPTTIGGTTTADLTLANKTVGSSTPIINGRTAASGEYVQFTAASASGANAVGAVYTILISCATNSSPARTLVRRMRIRVIP